jgi:pimeloyl-ACP methyl ester carboxylesterase
MGSSKSSRSADTIPAGPSVVNQPETEPKWVLLHGTPLTPRVWDEVGAILAISRRVVAPALPRPGTQAEIAGRVLASLEDTRAPLHVVGHSFGGQVAIEVALAAPLRLASLTILCSRATPFPAFVASAESLRRGDPLDVEESLARWFLPDELAADGPTVRFARACIISADRALWADDLQAIAGYDRTGDLGGLEVPTRVIAAEFDSVGTPDEMRALAGSIPGAEFVLVPHASHMSQFLDPAALAELITGTSRLLR